MPYQHQEFPKAKYHATEGVRSVRSAEAEADLGPGWVDSPAQLPQKDALEEERKSAEGKLGDFQRALADERATFEKEKAQLTDDRLALDAEKSRLADERAGIDAEQQQLIAARDAFAKEQERLVEERQEFAKEKQAATADESDTPRKGRK